MSPANGFHSQGHLVTDGPGGGQQAHSGRDTSSPHSVSAWQDTAQHQEAGAAACQPERLLLHSHPQGLSCKLISWGLSFLI